MYIFITNKFRQKIIAMQTTFSDETLTVFSGTIYCAAHTTLLRKVLN